MKKIALSLSYAGWGDISFWLKQPIASLGGWLRCIKEIIKKRKKK